LTIVINGTGSGTVSNYYTTPYGGAKVSITNGVMLEAGRSYQVQANPLPGSIFTNFLIGPTYVGHLPAYPKATYNFIFQPALVITATFLPNPFTNVAGIYDGLFYETGGVEFDSSGFVRTTTASNGTYTVNLLTDGDNLTVANASFDASGYAHVTIPRQLNHPTLGVDLQLDHNNSDIVTGIVSSVTGPSWTAAFTSSRTLYKRVVSNTPFMGNYSMNITNTGAVKGYACGVVNVNGDGVTGITGFLGDGTATAQGQPGGVYLSKDGIWPLFFTLYKNIQWWDKLQQERFRVGLRHHQHERRSHQP